MFSVRISFAPIFVAVGEFISSSSLNKDSITALDNVRGCVSDQQSLNKGPSVLDVALLQAHQLSRSHLTVPDIKSLKYAAEETVEAWIRKYDKSLVVVPGDYFKKTARMILW